MIHLFRKEWNQFFSSIIGVLALVITFLALGLIVFVFPESNVLDYGYATLESFFELTPWVLLFLIPAITMRLFAEEYAAGSLELLITKPLRLIDIVGGKYLASALILLFVLFLTLVYPYIISNLAEPKGNIDNAAIAGSYFGLFLLGLSFLAIGLFASAISKSQIAAFILAFAICFACYYAFDSLSRIPALVGKADYFLQNLGLQYHYNSLSRGVITLKDVVYFLSVIVFFLALTLFTLERRRK